MSEQRSGCGTIFWIIMAIVFVFFMMFMHLNHKELVYMHDAWIHSQE